MSELSGASRHFLDHYDPARAAGAPDWLVALRETGRVRFSARGLPTPRMEAWKYTNLRDLEKVNFTAPPARTLGVGACAIPALLPAHEPAHRMVFMNGRFQRNLSAIGDLPEGVELGSVAALLAEDPGRLENLVDGEAVFDALPMLALNTALFEDGYFLRLAPGVTLRHPVEVVFMGAPTGEAAVYHPRNVIVAGEASRGTIIEHHVAGAPGVYFSNTATRTVLGARASIRHAKIQDEARDAYHVATDRVSVGRDAVFSSFVFALGGRVARNEIRVRLEGSGADCRLNGAYMARGDQHIDNTTLIDHAHPNTASRQVYKGVLDERARGVFQGSIVVRPHAQKADGHQLHRALLLSDQAEVDAKPELEIYADDVKCSHGATAGELDAGALFYLRSRGIPEPEARRLLVAAFLGEVIDGIALAGLREPLDYFVERWMAS